MSIFNRLFESKEAREKRMEAERLAEEAEIKRVAEEIKAKRLVEQKRIAEEKQKEAERKIEAKRYAEEVKAETKRREAEERCRPQERAEDLKQKFKLIRGSFPGTWEEASKYEALRQNQKLKLADALIFLERMIIEAGGNQINFSLLMTHVVEIVQRKGSTRKVSVPRDQTAQVATLSMLLMSLVFRKEFRGLMLLAPDHSWAWDFEARIAGSSLTSNELVVQCGRKTADGDSLLGDISAFETALLAWDTITIMKYQTFEKARHEPRINSALYRFAAWGCMMNLSPGVIEAYEGILTSQLIG